MTLQEKIVDDLRNTRDDPALKKILRIVVGELQRQPKKVLSDDEVVRILKKLYKAEEELIAISGRGTDPAFLAFVGVYLPEEITEEEVVGWIKNNVDFSGLKNKMQAVGITMKHFGTAVDGNTIKDIIQKKF